MPFILRTFHGFDHPYFLRSRNRHIIKALGTLFWQKIVIQWRLKGVICLWHMICLFWWAIIILVTRPKYSYAEVFFRVIVRCCFGWIP